MSMPFVIKQTCFVCGKESSVTVMASTNTLGGTPDLDLRPAEMMRSTMPRWIQECPHCGYIAGSLDKETTVTQKWLKGMHFISCGDRWFRSDLAEKFYKYYLICMEDKHRETRHDKHEKCQIQTDQFSDLSRHFIFPHYLSFSLAVLYKSGASLTSSRRTVL